VLALAFSLSAEIERQLIGKGGVASVEKDKNGSTQIRVTSTIYVYTNVPNIDGITMLKKYRTILIVNGIIRL